MFGFFDRLIPNVLTKITEEEAGRVIILWACVNSVLYLSEFLY